MEERYIYLIRLVTDEYTLPHIKAFIDKDLADEYFENDLKFYRKKDWSVDDNKNDCGLHVIRRALMVRKDPKTGEYEHMSLLMERLDIIRR